MLSLTEELEHLLQRGIRVPASGKIVVDEAAIQNIVQQMREVIPDEVRLGQHIASEREQILADARAQARRMLDEAQAQLNARLDEQAIVQAARQRAREIQGEAEQRATALRADANVYVIDQLNALENRIQRLLHEVQAGQRALDQGIGDQGASTPQAPGTPSHGSAQIRERSSGQATPRVSETGGKS